MHSWVSEVCLQLGFCEVCWFVLSGVSVRFMQSGMSVVFLQSGGTVKLVNLCRVGCL